MSERGTSTKTLILFAAVALIGLVSVIAFAIISQGGVVDTPTGPPRERVKFIRRDGSFR